MPAIVVTNKEYLLPDELLTFYDKRRLLALLSDSGIPAVEADLSSTTSAAYVTVYRLIRSVSSLIDSRCQQGKRYARVDLENIAYKARTAAPGDAEDLGTDPDKKYEAKMKRFALLQQLTADLFYGDLMSRRGYAADTMKQMAPRYEDALLQLEQLFEGQSIFDLDEPKNAGVPSVKVLSRNRLMATDFNRMFGVWPNGAGNLSYGLFGSWRY